MTKEMLHQLVEETCLRMFGCELREATEKQAYRALCVTAGRAVRVLRPGQVRTGTAEAVNEDFALLVRWDNGEQEALSSGEVSVRGLLGYG